MPSNYTKDDPVFGTIDLDDQYVTDQWLVDKYVGGTLFTWGENAGGGIGISNTTNYSSPIQVGSLTSWKQVVAVAFIRVGVSSYQHTIKTDGTLWACGNNFNGCLGNGNTTSYSSPIQIGALTNWKQVDGSYGSGAAIKYDGTLWTWGFNGAAGELGNTGQLGISVPQTPYSSPVQVGALTNWKQVSVGYCWMSAIKQDGTLWTWGQNSWGGLGRGLATTAYYSSPVQVGSLTNWKQVWTGRDGFAAIKTDGTLWTCGRNDSGQLGNGNRTSYSSPIQVGSLTNWKTIGFNGGSSHCLAIKTDGTLWAWGGNDNGQLGNGNRTNYSSPIQIGALTNWKQVAAGWNSSLAIKTDGTLWAWGENTTGGLGNGNRTNYSSPIQVGSLTNWKQVSIGYEMAAAVTFADLT